MSTVGAPYDRPNQAMEPTVATVKRKRQILG